MKKLLFIFLLSFPSIIFGFFGLILGALLGGNFGFFNFGGLPGYEGAGIFFAFVGIQLGSLFGALIIKKRQKYFHFPKVYHFTISIITLIASLLAFQLAPEIGYLILLLSILMPNIQHAMILEK